MQMQHQPRRCVGKKPCKSRRYDACPARQVAMTACRGPAAQVQLLLTSQTGGSHQRMYNETLNPKPCDCCDEAATQVCH